MSSLSKNLLGAPAVLASCLLACTHEQPPPSDRAAGDTIRVATFNIEELSTTKIEQEDPQALAAAEIIRRVRPDILVLNEIDLDAEHPDDPALNARRFRDRYLQVGDTPLEYSHIFSAPSNTGVLTGLDLNGDGVIATEADVGTQAYGDDAYGFGTYPGQYAMAVLSRFPIRTNEARTFQTFRWVDLPNNLIPDGFYSPEALAIFRLSSKSHWDLPIAVGSEVLRLLVSHPTPPVFDGPEDRNGRRNFDEVGFWIRYLDNDSAIYDDRGRRGGFGATARFVIAGDLNARPDQTESMYGGRNAISQLLADPRLADPAQWVTSTGALQERPAGAPNYWERATARFEGGSRVDYVLPSHGITVVGGGVFWPDAKTDSVAAALAERASDHRLVWIDITW